MSLENDHCTSACSPRINGQDVSNLICIHRCTGPSDHTFISVTLCCVLLLTKLANKDHLCIQQQQCFPESVFLLLQKLSTDSYLFGKCDMDTDSGKVTRIRDRYTHVHIKLWWKWLTHGLQDKLVLSDCQGRLNTDSQLGGLYDRTGLHLHLESEQQCKKDVKENLNPLGLSVLHQLQLTCTVTEGTGSPSISWIRACCEQKEREW